MANLNNPWERLMRWTLGQNNCEIVALSDEPPTLAVSYDGDSDDDLDATGANFTEAAQGLCDVLERREMLPAVPRETPTCAVCEPGPCDPEAHGGY